MRAPLITLIALLVFNGLVDAYIYRQSRCRCHNIIWSKLQKWSAIALAIVMIVEIALPSRSGSETMLLCKMWILFSYLTFYIPKYIATMADLIASIPLWCKHHRLKWLTKAGITLAVVLFCGMWWGALINRYNIRINEITVEIEGLPQAFDGYRIAQFSDLHTGTFGTDTTFVSKLVDNINSLGADAIVFTGDIVNRNSLEVEPFVSQLSRLYAPAGVFAILGNHDYGDYSNWPSQQSKQRNMQLLYDAFDRMNMELLLNESRWLRCGNDSIALIGVENIGDPPFKIYGSLAKAYPNLADNNIKILLSHNPTHWTDSIADTPEANVALTLAGHTHAMQIEMAGVSPAALRYPTWGGLYTDRSGHRSLYVNIGVGTVGIPMRLGATPEITLITLRPLKNKCPNTQIPPSR